MDYLTVTDYKGIRVLTTQQIAEAYGTTTDTITKNFNRNKERYIKGKHFISLGGEEKNAFVNRGQFDRGLKNAKILYLWTKKGAFLHAKSLNTDTAWEVYDRLVDNYFDKQAKPKSAIEQLQLQSQAILEVNEKIDTVKQELDEFKQDMPLLAVECERITTAVHKRGVDALGGKNSNAYRDSSLRGKIYQDIHREVKRQFGVNSYKAIKRNQCDLAVSVVEEYELPLVLQEQIRDCNAQVSMRREV